MILYCSVYFVFFIKAKILEEIVAYAKCFSLNIGHNFTSRTILLTAVTGTAAVEIGGVTSASAFKYMRRNDHGSQKDIDDFTDTRMCIMDECSFASWNILPKISKNLKAFTECTEYSYGNVAFIFLGDFCQLEAIRGDCFYEPHDADFFWKQELNCMVELLGGHRFKDCKFMGKICSSMRNGCLTKEDRDLLNSRVVGQNGVQMPDPRNTHFASFCNRLRCGLNAAIFKVHLKENHSKCTQTNICSTSIIIKADPYWAQNKTALNFDQRHIFFQHCSEADTNNSQSSRCDPLLCLFYNSNVMVNENADVENGIANGTNCLFKYAKLKPGTILQPIMMHGFWVNSVSVNDVEYLQLEWQDSTRFKGLFRVYSETRTFVVSFPIEEQNTKIRIKAKMCLKQFPIVVNFATTGHKLQGKSMLSLVISEWAPKNIKNWAYVVISRVRTLLGLFLLKRIPDDCNFSPPKEYLDMMDDFRKTILAQPEDVAELKATYNCNGHNTRMDDS